MALNYFTWALLYNRSSKSKAIRLNKASISSFELILEPLETLFVGCRGNENGNIKIPTYNKIYLIY